mmetsp:Transcript_109489/g.186043  ORF Transcript_109489/g.186043 Transcript_109489/m.186043 type:complete len:218 (+) Transcript_109489:453-1106(+)
MLRLPRPRVSTPPASPARAVVQAHAAPAARMVAGFATHISDCSSVHGLDNPWKVGRWQIGHDMRKHRRSTQTGVHAACRQYDRARCRTERHGEARMGGGRPCELGQGLPVHLFAADAPQPSSAVGACDPISSVVTNLADGQVQRPRHSSVQAIHVPSRTAPRQTQGHVETALDEGLQQLKPSAVLRGRIAASSGLLYLPQFEDPLVPGRTLLTHVLL